MHRSSFKPYLQATGRCLRALAPSLLALILAGSVRADDAPASPAPTNALPWNNRALSIEDCLNIALQQNAEVLKSQKEIQVALGLGIQTRAILVPKVQAAGDFSTSGQDAVDVLAVPPSAALPEGFDVINPGPARWGADIRLVQTLFEGGRLLSSVRTARLLNEQALARHQAVVSDVAADVRVAYYNVLLAEKEIVVNLASVELLQKELDDSERRFKAGTVPRFNVLRAEVELANARPGVSRARNAYRISKNLLVDRLGYNVPKEIGDDIPLQLSGSLEVPRLDIAVPRAVAQALERRPELAALQKGEDLRREGVVSARAGYYPKLQGFVGYGARKSSFSEELGDDVHGWQAGVQATWSIFDGAYTRGKVIEARALLEKSEVELADQTRRIELEVRAAYSTLVEAWEVLESQKKVLEQADEAVRLSMARSDAGTGTQLDVLSAQTALTQARTIHVRSQREYAVARTRLERAIGAYVPEVAPAAGSATPK